MAPVQSPPLSPLPREDPSSVFRFWIEMMSVVEGMFMECSGLSMERDVLEFKEGGVNDHVHILPGRTRYPRIVLKHGLLLSSNLWDWYQEGLYNCLVRRIDLSIILYNSQNERIKCWNVHKAFPAKWVGPDLKADSNQLAVESIEIAHHGLELGPISNE